MVLNISSIHGGTRRLICGVYAAKKMFRLCQKRGKSCGRGRGWAASEARKRAVEARQRWRKKKLLPVWSVGDAFVKNKENHDFRVNDCRRRYTRQISCNHIIIQSFNHHEDASLALWALFNEHFCFLTTCSFVRSFVRSFKSLFVTSFIRSYATG